MDFFEIFSSVGMNIWIYGGSFVLVLSLLVFVHEWGHYIVARMSGVRIDTFSIGFGKEIFGFDDKAGTRWKISMFPLGGYVKMYGDIDPASTKHDEDVKDEKTGETRPFNEEEKKVAFFAKSVWKRSAIVFAGPAINYIFAIILLSGLFMFNGQPVTPPSAAAIVSGSAAEKAGFLPHDMIVSINGRDIYNFSDIRREVMVGLDSKKHFVVQRGDETIDIYAKPELIVEKDRFGFSSSRGLLGIISPRDVLSIKSIKSIDGVALGDVEDVRGELLARMGNVFEVEIDRGEETASYLIHPVDEFNEALDDIQSPQHDFLFVSDIEANVFIKHPPLVAIKTAVHESWVITVSTLEALGQIVVGTRSAKELGGIIRIGAIAGDMAQQGIISLIYFTALLSINLGLINLLPIPLLDGGHLVFYMAEVILRRPVSEKIQEYAFRAGFVFLIGVMIFANLNDILQLIS